MLNRIFSVVQLLLSFWALYLFLTLDPESPVCIQRPDTWGVFLYITIMIIISSIIGFGYFIMLQPPYQGKGLKIVLQVGFALLLVFSLNYNLGDSLLHLRIYNGLLFCFWIYYLFDLVRLFFFRK